MHDVITELCIETLKPLPKETKEEALHACIKSLIALYRYHESKHLRGQS